MSKSYEELEAHNQILEAQVNQLQAQNWRLIWRCDAMLCKLFELGWGPEGAVDDEPGKVRTFKAEDSEKRVRAIDEALMEGEK